MSITHVQKDLKFLHIMEIFAGLARGSYLVCVGWMALTVSNDVRTVGQVFITAMLTSILAGPVVGVIVDRSNRKYLVMLAHLGIFLILAALAVFWIGSPTPQIIWLFLAVAAISALRMMHHSAHDGLIQKTVNKSEIMFTLARFRTIHLLAAAIGTVAVGTVIQRISPSAGFLFAASMSLLLTFPMIFVNGSREISNAPGIAGFTADLKSIVGIFRNNREIRLLAILAGISLPVGQLSNAILSSFIRDDLGRGSEAFAIVDAAWPIGGMLAGILLSLSILKLTARNLEYLFAAFVGLSTIALSFCTSLPLLVVFHGAMGITVWICRILIDGKMLQICKQDNVGRTKVGIEMVFSFTAMVMCLSPTLITLPSTAMYFRFWGAVTVICSILVYFWNLNVKQRRPV